MSQSGRLSDVELAERVVWFQRQVGDVTADIFAGHAGEYSVVVNTLLGAVDQLWRGLEANPSTSKMQQTVQLISKTLRALARESTNKELQECSLIEELNELSSLVTSGIEYVLKKRLAREAHPEKQRLKKERQLREQRRLDNTGSSRSRGTARQTRTAQHAAKHPPAKQQKKKAAHLAGKAPRNDVKGFRAQKGSKKRSKVAKAQDEGGGESYEYESDYDYDDDDDDGEEEGDRIGEDDDEGRGGTVHVGVDEDEDDALNSSGSAGADTAFFRPGKRKRTRSVAAVHHDVHDIIGRRVWKRVGGVMTAGHVVSFIPDLSINTYNGMSAGLFRVQYGEVFEELELAEINNILLPAKDQGHLDGASDVDALTNNPSHGLDGTPSKRLRPDSVMEDAYPLFDGLGEGMTLESSGAGLRTMSPAQHAFIQGYPQMDGGGLGESALFPPLPGDGDLLTSFRPTPPPTGGTRESGVIDGDGRPVGGEEAGGEGASGKMTGEEGTVGKMAGGEGAGGEMAGGEGIRGGWGRPATGTTEGAAVTVAGSRRVRELQGNRKRGGASGSGSSPLPALRVGAVEREAGDPPAIPTHPSPITPPPHAVRVPASRTTATPPSASLLSPSPFSPPPSPSAFDAVSIEAPTGFGTSVPSASPTSSTPPRVTTAAAVVANVPPTKTGGPS